MRNRYEESPHFSIHWEEGDERDKELHEIQTDERERERERGGGGGGGGGCLGRKLGDAHTLRNGYLKRR